MCSRETRSAQAWLLRRRSSSRFIRIPVSEGDADVARLGEEAHRLESAFAAGFTATDDVVEVRDGGQVLAGPANDQVETGGHVRTIGYDPRHRVAD